MKDSIREIIIKMGEDPNRQGLIDTPERVMKSMEFLTRGYKQNLDEIVNGALFDAESDDMVILKNVEFYSMCEQYVRTSHVAVPG